MALRLSRIVLLLVLYASVSALSGGSVEARSVPERAAVPGTPSARAALDIGCPSPPGAPHGIKVWLHIAKWCALSAVRGQAQFKLQLQIENRARRSLGVGLEHMRLIVASLDVRRWSPPESGAATVERPFRTRYLGRTVWAIPPNAEDAYDPVPHVRGDLTFATHWGQSSIAPGQTFNPSFHSGDLVFYVPYLPNDPSGAATSEDVLGMAYVYGREIVVLCPKENWGPKVPAAAF